MNENESAAPFSFKDAKSGSPRPELLSGKELMRVLAIVVELGEKRLRRQSPNSLA